jgi:hypothetical protein
MVYSSQIYESSLEGPHGDRKSPYSAKFRYTFSIRIIVQIFLITFIVYRLFFFLYIFRRKRIRTRKQLYNNRKIEIDSTSIVLLAQLLSFLKSKTNKCHPASKTRFSFRVLSHGKVKRRRSVFHCSLIVLLNSFLYIFEGRTKIKHVSRDGMKEMK